MHNDFNDVILVAVPFSEVNPRDHVTQSDSKIQHVELSKFPAAAEGVLVKQASLSLTKHT